ncbi:MAG TPA: tetratricopeptide repeat protein [Kiritimatiellia bacterium]|nr:tetratricopeptide repeat protein [Kiritimatiellia bacterium]
MDTGSVYSNRPDRSRSRRFRSEPTSERNDSGSISSLSSATGSISPSYRQRSSRGESSRSRGRRSRRRDPDRNPSGRLLWFGLAAGVAIYLAFLALHEVQQRRQRPAPPPPPPTDTVEVEESGPDLSTPPPPNPRPLRPENIRDWSRAARHLDDAQKHLRDGRIADAEERINSALLLAPQHQNLRLLLAQIRIEQKNYSDAKLLLLETIERDPSALPPRLLLANVLAQLDQHEEALLAANWILETDTYSETGHRIAAQSLLALNRTSLALNHLNRLVVLNRDNTEARNQLGQAHLTMGNPRRALDVFDEILRADPANSQARYHTAVALAALNDFDRLDEEIRTSVTRFGRPFVRAWLTSDDFDPVRENPRFIAIQSTLGPDIPAGSPPATSSPDEDA